MTRGVNINITGITVGHHFSMIQDILSESGSLSKLTGRSREDFYAGRMLHVCTRKVWGATYEVEISYNTRTDTFIVKCS